MGIRTEIRNAIKNGALYDFIGNNQHRMDKDDLVELVKNLDFTAYSSQAVSYPTFCDNLIENLTDAGYFDDEICFRKTKYQNGNLAIVAMYFSGERYGNLTVNISKLDANFAALDVNNYPDAEFAALNLGASPTGTYIESGFCKYPVFDFSKSINLIPDLEAK